MAGETVLIAAFSGRALAQSARRAGYEPLVVDAFGDLDMRAAAADFRIIDGAMQTGFRTKPLIAALEDLAKSAASAPIGLVLGSGFEDKTRLVSALASRHRLLGSDAAMIAACKAPTTFFAMLDALRIDHPETQATPPEDATGWVSKRVGGSGGRHIRNCTGQQRARPRRYFQKRLDGERLSVGGLMGRGGPSSFSLTRQWISASAEHPFRFGGCVSMPDIDDGLHRRLVGAASDVAQKLGLAGMASFDFIVECGIPYLLEVNPRPGASLDVVDDDHGYWFGAHVASCRSVSLRSQHNVSGSPKAMAILHADRGPVTLGETPWPEWSADRGAPGSFIPEGAPLATVFAEASTADAAEALARERLAELEDLIYGHATSYRHGDL